MPAALDQRHEACSLDTTMHYSCDFVQHVHNPSNPMQPGPIYFKTPRKCGIFGVMCEAIPRQINYLIDEASDVGKGVNTTIRLSETCVHLHAANCSGQNKNNYFIWNLTWRTINQFHHFTTPLKIILISDCWSHEVWARPLLRSNQTSLQSDFHIVRL